MPSLDRDLWDAVDALVDRAPSLDDLVSHKLELFAVRRWRQLGRPVADELAEAERRAVVTTMVVPLVLEKIRAAYAGDVIPMKGPVVAKLYREPSLRSFSDLDLLVEDPQEAQASLVAAGFAEVDDPTLFEGIHHLRPLWYPGLPLGVELHSRPNWPLGVPAPPVAELFARAHPAVEGVRALPLECQALLTAGHSWRHEPLRRLRDMIDVVVLADAAGRANVTALAREWGVERLWSSTIAAAEAALFGGSDSWAVRVWAQNLVTARERTVLESHLTRLLSEFWVLPFGVALARLPKHAARAVLPVESESWGQKLSRTGRALRNATLRRSVHDREVARH
jgi:hypothetical protein